MSPTIFAPTPKNITRYHDSTVLDCQADAIAQPGIWDKIGQWANSTLDAVPAGITEAVGMVAIIAVLAYLFDWRCDAEG
jgi:hypothetical protein